MGLAAATKPPEAVASTAIKAVAATLRHIGGQRHDMIAAYLAEQATTQGAPQAVVTTILDAEQVREIEFQRRSAERLKAALTLALQADDPSARAAGVRAAIAREQRYAHQRDQAVFNRAVGALERAVLQISSPQGAYWALGPAEEHCPYCPILAGHFWPWEILLLPELAIPVHHGCACRLRSYGEALAGGMLNERNMPSLEQAQLMVRPVIDFFRLQADEEQQALTELHARLEEYENGGDANRLCCAPLQAVDWNPADHPRDPLTGRFVVLVDGSTSTLTYDAEGAATQVADAYHQGAKKVEVRRVTHGQRGGWEPLTPSETQTLADMAAKKVQAGPTASWATAMDDRTRLAFAAPGDINSPADAKRWGQRYGKQIDVGTIHPDYYEYGDTLPDPHPLNVVATREIVGALDLVRTKYPEVFKKLHGVRTTSASPGDDETAADTLANDAVMATGADPQDRLEIMINDFAYGEAINAGDINALVNPKGRKDYHVLHDSVGGIMLHELGHVWAADDMDRLVAARRLFDDKGKDWIWQHISTRGAAEPGEMLAEIWAASVYGKPLPPEAQALLGKVAERWDPALHPRDPATGRFIDKAKLLRAVAAISGGKFIPWESGDAPGPRFTPATPPRSAHEAWMQEPQVPVLYLADCQRVLADLPRGSSTKGPEGVAVQCRADGTYRIDGPTGTHIEHTRIQAAVRWWREEREAHARRFQNAIPGNPLGKLPGVDVPSEDPVGDAIGGMLHGGWIKLPHGTRVHRKPGEHGAGDQFEVIATDGRQVTVPATDKEAATAAAVGFEGDNVAAKDVSTPHMAPGYNDARITLHRISAQVLGPVQYPSNEIALHVDPDTGSFHTPDYTDPADGKLTRVSVVGNQIVRTKDGTPDIVDPVPGVDAAAAANLAEVFRTGQRALETISGEARDNEDTTTPTLWPEHFDLAIEHGISTGARANVGVSPGDTNSPEPYFYVGPWAKVEGPLWNATTFNGAVLTWAEVLKSDNPTKLVADFYRQHLNALRAAPVTEADWNPWDHPRDPLGRFAPKHHTSGGLLGMSPFDEQGAIGMRQALTAKGHTPQAIAATEKLMDRWNHDDTSANLDIVRHLNEDTPTGKALRDRIEMETAAAERVVKADPQARLYRQGVMTEPFLHTTTNRRGAQSFQVMGQTPRFKPDHSGQLKRLLKKYAVLGGYHYQPGYAGEDEVALIDRRILDGKARVVRRPEQTFGSFGGMQVPAKDLAGKRVLDLGDVPRRLADRSPEAKAVAAAQDVLKKLTFADYDNPNGPAVQPGMSYLKFNSDGTKEEHDLAELLDLMHKITPEFDDQAAKERLIPAMITADREERAIGNGTAEYTGNETDPVAIMMDILGYDGVSYDDEYEGKRVYEQFGIPYDPEHGKPQILLEEASGVGALMDAYRQAVERSAFPGPVKAYLAQQNPVEVAGTAWLLYDELTARRMSERWVPSLHPRDPHTGEFISTASLLPRAAAATAQAQRVRAAHYYRREIKTIPADVFHPWADDWNEIHKAAKRNGPRNIKGFLQDIGLLSDEEGLMAVFDMLVTILTIGLEAFGIHTGVELPPRLVADLWEDSEFERLHPRNPHTGEWIRNPVTAFSVDLPSFATDTEPPVDVGGDVVKACDLLAQGRRVELNQPHEVSTLLDKLAERVKEAEAKGEKAPVFDLCKVTVKGTNLFCVKSQGIPRVRMPQLKGHALPGSKAADLKPDKRGEVDITPAFIQHLIDKGYAVRKDNVPAEQLKATQNELNGAKVAGIVGYLRGGGKIEGQPLVVSKDDYILDGHHRWASNVALDLEDNKPGDIRMDVTRIDIDTIEMLIEALRFAHTWGIPVASVAEDDAFERLHPRDAKGRFVRTGMGVARDGIDLAGASINDLLGGLVSAGHQHTLMNKPRTTAAVKEAVTDRESFGTYLKDKLGIEATMDEYEGTPQFYQELAQAITDGLEQIPVLKGGPRGKLARVGVFSELPPDVQADPDSREGADEVWGQTSWDPDKSHTLRMAAFPEGPQGTFNPRRPDANAVITLFDIGKAPDADFQLTSEGHDLDEEFEGGMSVQPTRWVYGRMMHELGHAAAQLSGADYAEVNDSSLPAAPGVMPVGYGQWYIDQLQNAGISPLDVMQFSGYAAHSPAEAYAEIFALFNVKGGIANLKEDADPELIQKLYAFRANVNAWAGRHGVPEGKLI